LRELVKHPRVRAIGEIGLDYYWDASPHGLQQDVLKEQLNLAAECRLPAVIHFREKENGPGGECISDLMTILKAWLDELRHAMNPLAERPGVLHSFSGSVEAAREAMELGFFIGVAGPLTFERNRKRQDLVASLALDRILVETDAPFQTPFPHRGTRNEPAYVRLIADKIALLHHCRVEQVAATTGGNASRLFAWD